MIFNQNILLLLAYLIGSVRLQELPRITKKILPEIKRLGETGMLNCTVARQGSNMVSWIRPKKDQITENDKISIEEHLNTIVDGWPKYSVYLNVRGDQRTYTLVVRRLITNDNGTYTCRVDVRNGDQYVSTEGHMIVLLAPAIDMTRTSATVIVQEGESTVLSCAATGYPYPNITWIRTNGRNLPKPYNKYSHKGNTLTLSNAQKEARGVYRCIADNNVIPTAKQDITVYVKFRPSAKAVQTSYGQMQNMFLDVTIQCIVAGYPQPELKWWKRTAGGREEIKNDAKHAIEVIHSHGQTLGVSEYWLSLLIRIVTANDYGEYECEGTNEYGKGFAVVEVYETSECQGANCILSDDKSSMATRTYFSAFFLFITLLVCLI
ncbi:DgyrCDS3041 [Dimorphilus gyrociliatus]|uniref:DgyrCDS3041 n=1 Tax=Dimorphilus gyrociliatus TaxID=2664684 RepID=A0A7I8VCK8_9ANNE|nr:DgyrCDS3041 [Dimorphilus gyrociliatus]